MFYEQNQLDSLLNCPTCMQRFDQPLMMPCCWKTVCKKCILKYNQNSDYLHTCPQCKRKNQSLKFSNLPVNEALHKLLNLKPVDLIHADLYRKLGDLFKTIQTDLEDLDLLEKNAQINLDTFFDTIKENIINNTRILIEKANNHKEKILNELEYLKSKISSNINRLFSIKQIVVWLNSRIIVI